MIPIRWQVLVLFLIVWILIGLLTGLLTGFLLQLLLRGRRTRLIASMVLGVIGAITAVSISGWASERTYNAGEPRRFFLWDSDGRLIDWRTALAENRFLLVVLCAAALVTLWHFAPWLFRKLRQGAQTKATSFLR